jgi:hypothetical protein
MEMLVVLGNDLDEQIVRAGHEHHVVDLGDGCDPVGDVPEITVGLDGDHRLAVKAHGERIRHGDDLDHATFDEPLRALPHRCFGEPHLTRDLGVRPAAVLLELLDDRLVGLVEDDGRAAPEDSIAIAASCCALLCRTSPWLRF